jgi:hypothetical protein
LVTYLSSSYADFFGFWKEINKSREYEDILESKSKYEFSLNYTWG